MVLKVVIFILFVIFSLTHGTKKYNTETFYINAQSTRVLSSYFAAQYYVYNVGVPTLTVQIMTRNFWSSMSIRGQRDIRHGESFTFRTTRDDLAMAVRVINHANVNGFIHAYSLYQGFKEFDERSSDFFDIYGDKLLHTLVVTGISKIPIFGEVGSLVTDFFWPEKEENVWEKVKEQVKELVDSRIQETIDGVLGGVIEQFKTRIKTVLYEIKSGNYTETTGTHYVNIAEDLVGLESRFKFKGENSVNTNYFLLPLFATTVNLKLAIYQYGILNWQKLRINKELLGRLTYYISEVVHNSASGAIEHIKSTCKDKIHKEYTDVYPEHIYDQLSSAQAYCALNGMEYFPLWRVIAANPKVTPKKPDVPWVVISNQFGRNTAYQSAEMVIPSNQAFVPKPVNGKMNLPVKITVFKTAKNFIAGMKVSRANGREDDIGKVTKDSVTIDFNGKRLMKLIAKGEGQINSLQFIFEGDRIIRVGQGSGPTHEFALENHHIVGFFMTNSKVRIDPEQAANIAVSYQVIVN